MKRWPSKSFLEVCDFQGGTQPPKSTFVYEPTAGYLRLIQIRDFDSDENPTYVPHDDRLKTCIDSDVMIARYGASLGRILRGKSGAYNVALVKTLPDESVLTKDFLFHWLTSPFFQSYLAKVGNRAAQAGFNKEDFAQLQIPLPPLGEQERIVKLLDEADALRKLRAKADRCTEAVIFALFHEMFGDPKDNTRRWPTKPLGDLLKIQNGFAFKSERFNNAGKGLPIIRIRDLARSCSETFYDGEHDTAYEVDYGDFLIGMDGEFRCYRWQGGKALLNQRVCRLQGFNTAINSSYIFCGINQHLSEIEANTAFVTVKHLSSKQIAQIKMSVPPLGLQKEFATRISEIRAMQAEQAASRRRLENLFQSMLHRAFNGSL